MLSSGLEGQTALVLQETTSARTPAQGTPKRRSHWSHAAGSARVQRKCSLHAVRPARASGRRGSWFQTLGSVSGRPGRECRRWLSCLSSGRTEKRFAGIGLPATSGDYWACRSRASAGPADRSLEFVSEESGARACGCFLFLFRWSWAERCSLPSPRSD